MKKLKTILLGIVFIFNIQLNHSQTKTQLENSLLWRVEHPSLDKPSFIFGTLHMMCASDFKLLEKVSRTLSSVEALVLELDLSDPEEMRILQTSMSAASKVSEELSTDQFSQLDTLVQRILGIPLINMDTFGLAMVNLVLTTKMLPCTDIKSCDLELLELAVSEKTPIYGLETAAEQLSILKQAYPTTFIFKQILLHDAYKKDFQNAIIAYNKEELTTAVSYLTKQEYMNENATDFMQKKRNLNWMEKIPEMMQERSNLFAVGAAHLTDDFGIIQLLKDKGYSVTPVFK